MIKKRSIILIFFIVHSFSYGNDYYNWLKNTDKTDDPIVIEYLNQSELGGKISIINSLSKREERDFSRVLEYIYYSGSLKPGERELLLYYSLEGFIKGADSAEKNYWILDLICSELSSYSDSLLRKTVIKKLDYIDYSAALKILLKHSGFLSGRIDRNSNLSSDLLEEAKIFLIQARKYDSIPLKESVLSLYQSVGNLSFELLK